MASQPSEALAAAPVQDGTVGAANDVTAPDDLSGMYPDDKPMDNQPDSADNAAQDGQPSEDQQTEAEPETAIDPPVSWPKEAKEKFSQLPPELQTDIAQIESQRNRQVQEVTTRAKEAQQSAAAEAAQQVAHSQQLFAQQLEYVAQQFLPPEPHPGQYQDMQSFQRDKYAYDQAIAQHQTLMQHAGQLRTQAQQELSQHEQQALYQEARRVALDLPELSDTNALTQLVQTLTPIAQELGYPEDRIAQAGPTDILAMKRVMALKADADKWRALQARKMEGVRAARGQNLPKVTQPGASKGGGQMSDDPKALLYPNDIRR